MEEKFSRRKRISSRSYKNKNKSGLKKILLTILTLLIVGIGGFSAYTFFNFSNSAQKGYKDVDYLKEVDPNFKKFSVLILGIDMNDDRKAQGQTREDSRTDSMILATVNKDKKRMDMVSIPRDSLSLMREKDDEHNDSAYFYDKITHAHAYNDVKGTTNAVENLLHTPINFYVLINFKAFEQTVDAFGGIDLYVPFDMDEQNANGEENTVKLTKGWHTLNGEKALAFARSRYYDSDIERGQRQLQAIHALIDKAKSLNALSKINEVINIAGDNVEHNLTTTQISSAIKMFFNNDIEIVSHRIDGYDVMYNGVYYYYPRPLSLLYASSALRDNLDLPLPKSTDLLNIYYQGHINIGLKKYKINNLLSKNIYPQAALAVMSPEDLLINLPEQLTKADLKNDITVSNENRPDENSNTGNSANNSNEQ
ncbi:LCP family protein [Gemella parahaemolysans]|jgi:putative transcriptional regulator